jgi:hypothetical protein
VKDSDNIMRNKRAYPDWQAYIENYFLADLGGYGKPGKIPKT